VIELHRPLFDREQLGQHAAVVHQVEHAALAVHRTQVVDAHRMEKGAGD
jgi:hypothetical protein